MNMYKVYIALASFPGPLRGRRKGLVHTVCACANVSVKMSVKVSVH